VLLDQGGHWCWDWVGTRVTGKAPNTLGEVGLGIHRFWGKGHLASIFWIILPSGAAELSKLAVHPLQSGLTLQEGDRSCCEGGKRESCTLQHHTLHYGLSPTHTAQSGVGKARLKVIFHKLTKLQLTPRLPRMYDSQCPGPGLACPWPVAHLWLPVLSSLFIRFPVPSCDLVSGL
jgi:hypothetical protein